MTTVRIPGQPLVHLDGLSRADWLALRKSGIGSSDAPAVAGEDPWRSPYAVWAEKVADEWPDEDKPAMEWGRILEAPIAQHFAEQSGIDVHPPTVMYVHPDREWMRASPDRLTVADDLAPTGILEIKHPGDRQADLWDDGPPAAVVIQVQHQLEVLGLDEAWVAALIGAADYRQYHVPRDDRLIEALVQIETDFWRRVVEHDPPPVDGHDSTTAALRELHATSAVGVERLLDAETVALVDELLHTKDAMAYLKESAASLENQIKAVLGDAEIGVDESGMPRATWKQQKPKDHVHNCPDCTHTPDGPPPRSFLPKKPKGEK